VKVREDFGEVKEGLLEIKLTFYAKSVGLRFLSRVIDTNFQLWYENARA